MRAYIPVGWAQLRELDATGLLGGPLSLCSVDPEWRAGAPDVDEEEWEFEAQLAAAQSLADLDDAAGGVVLAVDLPDARIDLDDGWGTYAGPLGRTDTAAVLTADLQWFAVQEIPFLFGA